MLPPILRIAFRNVLRNRRRSIITFSAVFLALGIMVGLRGFLNGMQATLRESIILGQTGALQVHRKGFLKSVNTSSLELDLPTDDAFMAKILAVPGVTAATARISFGGMVNANDASAVALFTAMDPKREPVVCPRRLEMISAGKTLAEAGPAAGIFTSELVANLGIQLTQKATLLTNDRDGVMNALELDFVGLYGQPGLPLPEKKIGFVPLAFAQELLRMPGRATEIAVATQSFDAAERIKPVLQAAVGPEYEVSTWHDVASFIDEAIAAQNFSLNLIAAIFLFVALLGIATVCAVMVLDAVEETGMPALAPLYGAGAALGLAMLTKYNAGLFALGLVITVLWYAPYRPLLRSPHFLRDADTCRRHIRACCVVELEPRLQFVPLQSA